MESSRSTTKPANLAFYYPGWIWRDADALKNLLLFFDGIALLVPAYMRDRVHQVDELFTSRLTEAGLLRILEPEELVDKAATEKLAQSLASILDTGALETLSREGTRFHELSYSRLGGLGDSRLADGIIRELKARGLAKDTEDGASVPLHPQVHALVLVLLAQILRPYGGHQGLVLQPATDQPQLVRALQEVLSLESMPSAGHVVATDLATVGVDLSRVPLDEVLSFREEHGENYRAYARSVREFVRQVSPLDERARAEAQEDRIEMIEDHASDLRRRSRNQWKRAASFGISIAGAVWSAATGDVVGPVFSGAQKLLTDREGGLGEHEAYSYLFRAEQQFPF